MTTIKNLGKEAYRIETLNDLEDINLESKDVAITAGASAPEHIVNEISNFLKPKKLEYYIDTDEDEYFPLPKELRANISSLSRLLVTMFPANNIEAKLNHQNGCPSKDPSTLPKTMNPSLFASWFILSFGP